MQRNLLWQPKKLEHLAITKLGDWIALQVKTFVLPISELHRHNVAKADASLTRQIENIRNHLDSNVPWMLHDLLATKTIRALKQTDLQYKNRSGYRTKVASRTIEILFTRHLNSLTIGFNTFVLFKYSFCSKSHLLAGLVHLELNADVDETDIILFLINLHSLRSLSIYHCTENILKCITENNQSIERLNLSHSHIHLNQNNMRLMCQLQNLKSINLNGISINRKDIETILLSCDKIEHIDIGVANIVIDALENIVSFERNAKKYFNLKTYTANGLTIEQLQLVIQTCPKIQKMTLYNNRTVSNNLKSLISLTDLRALTLGWYNFYDDQVKELLQIIGCNLLHLDLECDQIDFNALVDISQTCPYLQSLFLNITPITINSSSHTKIEIPPFRNLKRLFLNFSMRPDPFGVSNLDESVFFVLSNCVNVEFLTFGRSVQFSTELMLKVLDLNSFVCLKELRVRHTHKFLIELVIDRIIQNRVSQPKVIMMR